jgi:hypothetical protein
VAVSLTKHLDIAYRYCTIVHALSNQS